MELISRQAVLDYIDKMPSELTTDGRRMIRRRTLEEYISDTLPYVSNSENPNKGEWIPVTERVPEKNAEVLATTEWGSITIAERYSANDYFINEGTTNADVDDIIAWMPLPEPYKAESEE